MATYVKKKEKSGELRMGEEQAVSGAPRSSFHHGHVSQLPLGQSIRQVYMALPQSPSYVHLKVLQKDCAARPEP